MVTYKINLKDKTIDFYNQKWIGDYYLPIEMFEIKDNFCEGIEHLIQKNWVTNDMLYSIGKDLSIIYNCDYEKLITEIINYNTGELEYLSKILKSLKYE